MTTGNNLDSSVREPFTACPPAGGHQRLSGRGRSISPHPTADDLRAKLPLRELMHAVGDGAAAKTVARCPFHDDHNPSFSTWIGNDGRHRWKCHAGCGEGAEPDYLMKKFGVDTAGAFAKWRELAGVNGNGHKPAAAPTPAPATDFNHNQWTKRCRALTDCRLKKLADERGYSIKFLRWWRSMTLVGLHREQIAFPVHAEGAVAEVDQIRPAKAVHYRKEDGTWRFYPLNCNVTPLTFGNTKSVDTVLAFESQWDMLAALDQLGAHKPGGLTGLAALATRGASNGKLVRGYTKPGATVFAFKQNDQPDDQGRIAADKWLADLTAAATAEGAVVKLVTTPAPHKDLNDWTRAGAGLQEISDAMDAATVVVPPAAPEPTTSTTESTSDQKPVIQFFSPSQLRNYQPPEGHVLVGDCHVVRGNTTVIGGAPGVGKSRAAVALAQAGAICAEWFGLKVHVRFKTMVIQTENGRFRLSREFADMDCDALEDFVRVCEPPPFGLAFDNPEFTSALKAEMDAFKPDVVVLDPWNAVAMDDKQRDYLEAFKVIRSVLPVGDAAPALVIVAHTRKPKADERASGRALMNLLAGSYVLNSVPRTGFVLQAASDDPEDDRVVWTCGKNNDGELGARSAWHRQNGLFTPAADFDWESFDATASDRPSVTVMDVAAVLEHGNRQLRKAELVSELMERTGAGKSCAYAALKKFDAHLQEVDGLWRWKA
jgi:hypothetical protein